MKNITHILFVSVFVLVAAFVVGPHETQAACYVDDHGQYCTSGSYSYSYNMQNTGGYYNRAENYSEVARLQALIRQLNTLLAQLERIQDGQQGGRVLGWNTSREGDVDVVTRSAIDVENDEATLRGELDWNGEDEATVYFEYGKSVGSLNKETFYRVLDEDDDDEDFEMTITNLKDDTRYYYRAVAEDEDGDDMEAADQATCEAAGGEWEVETNIGTVSGNIFTLEAGADAHCDCDDDCDWDAVEAAEDEESCEAIDNAYWVPAECFELVFTSDGS